MAGHQDPRARDGVRPAVRARPSPPRPSALPQGDDARPASDRARDGDGDLHPRLPRRERARPGRSARGAAAARALRLRRRPAAAVPQRHPRLAQRPEVHRAGGGSAPSRPRAVRPSAPARRASSGAARPGHRAPARERVRAVPERRSRRAHRRQLGDSRRRVRRDRRADGRGKIDAGGRHSGFDRAGHRVGGDRRSAPLAGRVRAWHANLGVVHQIVFLADTTIRRNIALGTPDREIDETRIAETVRLAQLEDFVASLPDGLDTVVGQRGVRLSGGQRQRLAIARAAYRRPGLLVFDEGTSALDHNTESALLEAIQPARGDRTMIVVTHRLATVENAGPRPARRGWPARRQRPLRRPRRATRRSARGRAVMEPR